MFELAKPTFTVARRILARQADRELRAGNVADAFELYARAGIHPSRKKMVEAAERLLDRGMIPYALRLYQRAQRFPDRQRLLRAADREQNAGMIYPEVYDLLMAAP